MFFRATIMACQWMSTGKQQDKLLSIFLVADFQNIYMYIYKYRCFLYSEPSSFFLSLPNSFGVVLWEIYARQLPFSDVRLNHFRLQQAIINGQRPEIPHDCPLEYAKLTRLCWNGVAQARPSFEVVRQVLVEIVKELG